MKTIKHKSRMRYLMGNNPTGELVRVISHQFTTANKRNRWTLSKESKENDED